MSKPYDPNLRRLEDTCENLADILDDLVLVGGCAIGLLITDRAQTEIRATDDVDLVTEITTTIEYYTLGKKLRRLGFEQNDGEVICRWTKGVLRIDIMPIDEKVLGFTNPWYVDTVKTAVTYTLQNNNRIKHATAPLFIATKLASFHDRGKNDYMHHDIEDIVTIINGRVELIDDMKNCPREVCDYIKEEFETLLADTNFTDILPGHLRPNENRTEIVIERFRKLTGQ